MKVYFYRATTTPLRSTRTALPIWRKKATSTSPTWSTTRS